MEPLPSKMILICQICYSHAPSSAIERKQSHRNISDVKIPICIYSISAMLPLCFLSLATWQSNATRSSSSRRREAEKNQTKRRRSKSRSYTLLCLAKSWLKAPERESSRKKKPRTIAASSRILVHYLDTLVNLDTCLLGA